MARAWGAVSSRLILENLPKALARYHTKDLIKFQCRELGFVGMLKSLPKIRGARPLLEHRQLRAPRVRREPVGLIRRTGRGDQSNRAARSRK